MLLIRVGSTSHLFANDILCLFVRPQPEEDRLTKLGPLGKLDLGDQYRFDPVAAFHHRLSNPKTPAALAFSGRFTNGQNGAFSF